MNHIKKILLPVLLFLPLLVFADKDKDSNLFDRRTALDLSQGVIGSPIGDYHFIDTKGVARQLSDYRGKPLVISLIYTSCYHICPNTTKHLHKVVKKAEKVLGESSFNVVTIGFDIPTDSAEAMRQFAKKQSVDKENWQFLAADKSTIDGLIQDLGFQFLPSSHGFDHLIQSTVIDADGIIYRQVYGVMFSTPHLIEPLKELVFGEEPKHSFFDLIGNRVRLFCTVYDPASDSYTFDYTIFIGLAVGLSLTVIFIIIFIKEWRYSAASRKAKKYKSDR